MFFNKCMDIKFFEINNGDLRITFSNLGASIFSIYYLDDLMTLTPSNKKDYEKIFIYNGKTIGRVANRIKGNLIRVDGETFRLKNNEKKNTLHGGFEGLSTRLFDYEIRKEKNRDIVEFKYISRHGESGFPGTLNLVVRYTIENNEIRLEYFGKVEGKSTPLNLTNHLYFTLGDKNIDRLKLKIPSDDYIETDNESIPKRRYNLRMCLNFNRFRYISYFIDDEILQNSRAKGYDHFIFFRDNKLNDKVNLLSSKYRLDIDTDYEGVQIYSDNYEDGIKYMGTNDLIHRGVAIEPSLSLLNENILKIGEEYRHFITYKFSKK